MMVAAVLTMIVARGDVIRASDEANTSKKFIIVIDSVSRYIFKANPDIELPTKNPRTGKPTITKALCCEQCAVCDRWKPVPLDVSPEDEPQKFHCPIHKTMMKSVGPIPNDLKFIEDLQRSK